MGELKSIFEEFEQVKLVYLFGSQARREAGPLSDYGFAVYLDEQDPVRILDIRLALLGELQRHLRTDNVEVVVLNQIESPELKYDIVANGALSTSVSRSNCLLNPAC